jgi:hypothetical protein
MEDLCSFDGRTFGALVFELLQAAPPTENEVREPSVAAQKHIAKAGEWIDKSGREWATSNALGRAGLSADDARSVVYAIHYPAAPDDVILALDGTADAASSAHE